MPKFHSWVSVAGHLTLDVNMEQRPGGKRARTSGIVSRQVGRHHPERSVAELRGGVGPIIMARQQSGGGRVSMFGSPWNSLHMTACQHNAAERADSKIFAPDRACGGRCLETEISGHLVSYIIQFFSHSAGIRVYDSGAKEEPSMLTPNPSLFKAACEALAVTSPQSCVSYPDATDRKRFRRSNTFAKVKNTVRSAARIWRPMMYTL